MRSMPSAKRWAFGAADCGMRERMLFRDRVSVIIRGASDEFVGRKGRAVGAGRAASGSFDFGRRKVRGGLRSG